MNFPTNEPEIQAPEALSFEKESEEDKKPIPSWAAHLLIQLFLPTLKS